MEDKIAKAIKDAKYFPTQDLPFLIKNKISIMEKREVWIKSTTLFLLASISLWGSFSTINTLLYKMSQSGFYEYLNIITSDYEIILSFWRELAYSLAESLPTVSLLYPTSLLLIFFISTIYFFKQIYKILPRHGMVGFLSI